VAALAVKSQLPVIYESADEVKAGGLMAYGPSAEDPHRLVATYVAKILNGAKPSDLPVEQPMRFDLVLNLRTAQALGLTIPHHVLLQATEIVQ
jgi:putative ABC transport system substrate-binding protein